MELQVRDGTDGYRWRCRRCRKTLSIRHQSFLAQLRLTLQKLVLVIYCWSIGMSVSTAKIMIGISETTVVDCFNFLREECATKLISLPQVDKQLGGPGVIVEVDESVLVKKKYHRGAWKAQHQQWLFGMYDREAHVGWIEYVDANTLLPIIHRVIRPGSIIHSDGWAAYNGIANLGYVHQTVIHAQNVANPLTGVHTNYGRPTGHGPRPK